MQNIEIKIRPGQQVWFTSDQHFGHKNIIKYCNRPFADTFAMDCWMRNSWNEVVGDNDIVFILGDITMYPDAHKIKKILDELKGEQIYIIPGNHDKVDKGFRLLKDRYDGRSDHQSSKEPSRYTILHDITRVKFLGHELGNMEVVCSHIPLMTWPGRDKNIPNLFGHIHSGPRCTNDGFDTNLPFWKNMYDVGVDNNDYTPVNLTTIWQLF